MNKYILISTKVKNNIAIPAINSENIIFTKHINTDIKKLVKINHSKSESTTYAVLFIHISEINKTLSVLHGKYDYKELLYKIIVLGKEKDLRQINDSKLQNISDMRTTDISEDEFSVLVRKSFLHIESSNAFRVQRLDFINSLQEMRQDQEDLINIGKSLSSIKDPDELINKILMISKKITGADAGSIYITEEDKQGNKYLRFKDSHTFSREIPIKEFTLAINKNSIAGYVATTGDTLNIPNAYNLPGNAPYSFDISWDRQYNYISRSMLVVPMRNHLDKIIGVIQLINSKKVFNGRKYKNGNEAFGIILNRLEDFDKLVKPFDTRYENLMESVAGQAAIAIENNRMIKQIQNQFEEFIKASVTAIESRDIATSGHSFRVAAICKEMAVAINNKKSGPFKDIKYNSTEIKELEFAALLHDFGKVYIDINIFKKEKKLYRKEFENLILKLNYLYRFIELSYKYEDVSSTIFRHKKNKKDEILKKVKLIKEKITLLNEPTVTEKDPKKILSEIKKDIRGIRLIDIDGNRIDLITKNEKLNLEIEQGSLNPLERKEIENHVIFTYNFVSKIPWPPEFKKIPDIVLNHHERPDGTGYPNRIKGKKIPVQARIMSIADIYDALIATDRPYKKAVSAAAALKIMQKQADDNKLDKDLLKIFIKQRIYKTIDKNTFKVRSSINE
ncbi:MAG: HD domain-containing protein [Spirochaetes bacterium]|nr:HD domain-containing protein [Spirochaetota bacterium]